MQGRLATLANPRFPLKGWAPVLRAQVLVAEFAATEWRDVDIPPPSYDPDDLLDEIMTLLKLRDLRGGRIGEIVAQAQDFTNYFADVLMIAPASHPACWAILCACEAIGQMVGMYYKNKWPDRPRPVQVYPALMTAIPTPPHPSYPNAHALQARMIANCFAEVSLALAPSLDLLVERIAENRAIAGLHFVTDKIGSEALAIEITRLMKVQPTYKDELLPAARIELGDKLTTWRHPATASNSPTEAIQGQPEPANTPHYANPPIASKTILLRTPGQWLARDQGNRTSCVAFAVTACIEQPAYADGQGKRLSEEFLYWAARKMADSSGVVRLEYARRVLEDTGICLAEYCRYDMSLSGSDPGDQPSRCARDDAATRTFSCGTYYDLKKASPDLPPDKVAGAVVDLLHAYRRPVAVCLKIFQDKDTKASAWSGSQAVHYGIIANPDSKNDLVGSHCICIVGWIKDIREYSGGYFLFRNSWGTLFAERAPSECTVAPYPGYGVISATYVNSWSYEILQVGDQN
jgi:hypothetical protein